mmetsp:Transcript_51105/g.119670  ORF Transcript_51105/g.119670 Transcript_51105/m.119670 type:complete len:307 (-) Transcript_51105:165-1085(-)
MANRLNDSLRRRTVEGPFNYYEGNPPGCATALDKGLAARISGHNYNIITNDDKDEIYFRNLRHGDHFVDSKNRSTKHFMGERRRKFKQDPRNLVKEFLTGPDAHPREHEIEHRRQMIQLAQIENRGSWKDFKKRAESLMTQTEPKRYSIEPRHHGYEMEKLRPKCSTKSEWIQRRGEPMLKSASAPSLALTNPADSLRRAVDADARKEATQRVSESANFAPWVAMNTYASSIDATALGKQHAAAQEHLSLTRLEPHDFAVTKKNNHFSAMDRLTRADPYFMPPRHSQNNSGVKYDMISNQRKWFRY